MEFTLLPMTRADLPALTQLNRLCFSVPWSTEALLAELNKPDAVFLAARVGGVLCGYGGFNFVLDEGYVANLATHPDYRRRGVARAVLAALCGEAMARQLRFLSLEVRVSNLAAQGLYTDMGFLPVGRRKNFYEAPQEDGLILTKYFDNKDGLLE